MVRMLVCVFGVGCVNVLIVDYHTTAQGVNEYSVCLHRLALVNDVSIVHVGYGHTCGESRS